MPDQPQNDYTSLVALIRTEMSLALEPLRNDIHSLKEQQYPREMIDALFKLRDERISRLETGWASVATKAAAAISALWAILSILHLIKIN